MPVFQLGLVTGCLVLVMLVTVVVVVLVRRRGWRRGEGEEGVGMLEEEPGEGGLGPCVMMDSSLKLPSRYRQPRIVQLVVWFNL